ncbi:hypothetical protein AVEN_4502-1 [Araneus ventricosus]|uniref:Retrovirus-related Pol polyprotein from transposon opus n=1 Tax=Araneus ventricosus TaxID=182803 RepID=A0A4Y2BMF5_ARAVE|nr:hypothetical protein AVEN_4502-1 [Araneus ventricosus]
MGRADFFEMSNVKTISGSIEYHELKNLFKGVTKPNSTFPKAIRYNTLHFIPTSGPPVTTSARRLHPAQLNVAKQEFEYMLENGICRPSRSNWASPPYIVPKGSTDWRPTGDYRKLNRVTKQEKYPVPHLQNFSRRLKGKKFLKKN